MRYGAEAMMVRRSREQVQPDTEVWYWADSQVTLYDSTGVQSHTFSNGKGVLTFASTVTSTSQWLRGTSVTKVTLPDTVTLINAYSFAACNSLTDFDFPSGTYRVYSRAFYYCRGLTKGTFHSKPATLTTDTFEGCSALADIYVPWASGAVANAPWGATNATIHYNS